MSSSGGSSFFSLVMAIALMTGAAIYAIKHRDAFKTLVAEAAKPAVAASARDEQPPKRSGDFGDIELKANESGHFETEAEVNGSTIDVLVDTGATLVALTYEDAERAGIYLKESDFTMGVKTANGTAKIAPVELSRISIGDITVRNVRGAVCERGKLHRTLLGMSFLSRLSRVEMHSNALVLHE